MNQTISVAVLALASGFLACSSRTVVTNTAPDTSASSTRVTDSSVPSTLPSSQEPPTIANPASVNCVKQGGRERNVVTAGGEFGVCEFDDGTRCESWRLQRGECRKGVCKDEMGMCKEAAQ